MLEIDQSSVKALYLRSQARTSPAGSGTVEHKMALADLRDAVKLQADNKTVAGGHNFSLSSQGSSYTKKKNSINESSFFWAV